MHTVIDFSKCALLVCLFSKVLSNCQPPHDKQAEMNITAGTIFTEKCEEYTCKPDGSWVIKQCSEITCTRKIGYVKADYSKPYPQCCAHPVCDLNKSET